MPAHGLALERDVRRHHPEHEGPVLGRKERLLPHEEHVVAGLALCLVDGPALLYSLHRRETERKGADVQHGEGDYQYRVPEYVLSASVEPDARAVVLIFHQLLRLFLVERYGEEENEIAEVDERRDPRGDKVRPAGRPRAEITQDREVYEEGRVEPPLNRSEEHTSELQSP